MAPIQRQRRRGLHTVHRVRLQQFRKSVLRQSTVTDSIGQTVPDARCSSSKGTVAEGHVHSDHFQHLTSSTTCPRTTTTSPVERMPTSTTYFRQIYCFCLRSWVSFCWKFKFAKLQYIVTILSLVILHGSVWTHARWRGYNRISFPRESCCSWLFSFYVFRFFLSRVRYCIVCDAQ